MKHLSKILAAALIFAGAGAAHAETAQLRIAQQFGVSYLPVIVAKEKGLIEKAVEKAGLPAPKIEWLQLSGAAAMNEALISGSLDFASAGIAPLITTWAKTKGTANVIGVAALGSVPNVLTSSNPDVKTIKDFTDKDRIALPAVKIGFQPQVLQMAAEKAFGQFDKLDSLTVSMPHPDATAALLSGKSEITAHFTSPPFVQQQLKDPRIHKVLSSYDVLGGPHTFNVLYTTAAFADANPKTIAAIIAALDEASAWIIANPADAAQLYIKAEGSKLAPDFVEAIIRDPDIRFTTVPEKAEAFADFQYRVGTIKVKPASWKDLFVAPLHDRAGS
ncbi:MULTISPECIES: ABC transporter substrate-binding protein [Rhodomicrobium]|uniref:ABC transporter substrate-binding protein n=1 Tax=Rhodomicrobium TaxID=1068 RepID=UPI001FDA33AE|nr:MULTISPECIES: ABC transporter substrate-binding protein [Rhodomicrobium]